MQDSYRPMAKGKAKAPSYSSEPWTNWTKQIGHLKYLEMSSVYHQSGNYRNIQEQNYLSLQHVMFRVKIIENRCEHQSRLTQRCSQDSASSGDDSIDLPGTGAPGEPRELSRPEHRHWARTSGLIRPIGPERSLVLQLHLGLHRTGCTMMHQDN